MISASAMGWGTGQRWARDTHLQAVSADRATPILMSGAGALVIALCITKSLPNTPIYNIRKSA